MGALLKKLWNLQELRQKQAKLKERLQKNEKMENLKLVKRQKEYLEQSIKLIKEKCEKLRQRLRSRELDYSQKQGLIKDLSSKLYGGKVANPKELSSLERKLQRTRKEVEEIEEEIVNLTIEQEKLEETLVRENENLKVLKINYKNKLKEYDCWKVEIEKNIQRLAKEEQELIKEIEPEVYGEFEKLKSKFGNFIVAKLESGTCTGCNMFISTGLVGQAAGRDLVKCENCGRILYRNLAGPGED